MQETYDQKYYREVRKLQPRLSRRKDKDAKCMFCRILLTSKFGTKTGGRLYCDDCRINTTIRRILNAHYQKRAYHKRKSLSSLTRLER